MIPLDTRTLSFLIAAVTLLLSGLLLCWCRDRRLTRYAMWAAGNTSFGIGWLFLSLQDVQSPVTSIVVANTLIALGYVFLLDGIRQFVRQSRQWRLSTLLVCGVFLGQSYWVVTDAPVAWLISFVMAMLSILACRLFLLLWRLEEGITAFARRVTAGAFMVNALVYYLLATGLFFTWPQNPLSELFPPSFPATVMFTCTLLCVIGWSVGFLFIADQRYRAELEEASRELERTVIARTEDLTHQIAERMQAEQALHASEERLSFVLASSPAVIYTARASGDFPVTYMSPNVERIFGYTSKDFLSDAAFWMNHLHPQDAPLVLVRISELFEQGFLSHEYRFLMSSGDYRWVRDELRLIHHDDGDQDEIIGYWVDIHEQKMAEEALRQSEVRYSELFQKIPLPTYMWQRAGEDLELVAYNEAASVFTRGKIAALLGIRLEEFYANLPEIRQDFHACISGQTIVRRDMLHTLRTSGETKNLGVHYAFVPPDMVLVHTEDISERVRMEELLRAQQARLQHAESLARIGHYAFDLDYGNPVWSEGHEELWGFEHDAHRPTSEYFSRIHSEDQESTGIAVAKAIQDMTGFDIEYRIVRPDGTVVTVHSVAEITPGQRAPLVAIRFTLEQFSLLHEAAYKNAQVRQQNLRVNLLWKIVPLVVVLMSVASLVFWRTWRTLAQGLAMEKDLRDQINSRMHEKEVLLTEIHHRVKNNLQIVSSLLYLQSRNTDDPVARSMLQESRNRIVAMSLIHQKLYQTTDFARIQFANYARELTLALLQSYGRTQAEVALTSESDDTTLAVTLAVPCGLILNEVVSNSLKYAFPDKRGGTIHIAFHQDATARYHLTMSDNGVGFPADFTTRRRSSLGITLIDRLVEQLRGTLERSTSPDGTRYHISFPQPKSTADEAKDQPEEHGLTNGTANTNPSD